MTSALSSVRCGNCGAPAVPLRVAGSSFCPYCGAYHSAGPATPGGEGVLVRDMPADAPCPLCESNLREAVIAELPAQACTRCGGLLCGMESFAHIVRARRAEYSGAELPQHQLNRDELARTVRCPRCRSIMSTHPYGGPGNVVIDTCISCGLVWLDRGELTALERAPGKR